MAERDDNLFGKIRKGLTAYWSVETLCQELNMFRVKTPDDEAIALGMLDKIGNMLVTDLPFSTENYFFLLESIHRNGQTPALRDRALDWIMDVGARHSDVTALVINQTRDLLNEEWADRDTRFRVTQGLGKIARSQPEQFGYIVLCLILNEWEESDENVMREKFNQAESILKILPWTRIENPRALIKGLSTHEKEDRQDGMPPSYASRLLDLLHEKQKDWMRRQIDPGNNS